jgi:hypothetical protein
MQYQVSYKVLGKDDIFNIMTFCNERKRDYPFLGMHPV